MIEYTMTLQEISKIKGKDDFALARFLASKGFKAKGDDLRPELLGKIRYTVDVEAQTVLWEQSL